MEMRTVSGDQRVGVLGVVVGALVVGASAGEVEALTEAVGQLAAVGVVVEVVCHERERLGHSGAVGERADPVPDTAVDLATDRFGQGEGAWLTSCVR